MSQQGILRHVKCVGGFSRVRRECQICHWMVAPGCQPKKCWLDELNHCRSCHALIEVLKHYRFKNQFNQYYCQKEKFESLSEGFGYLGHPVGMRVTILTYLCPVRDLIWSTFHRNGLSINNYKIVTKLNITHSDGPRTISPVMERT